MGLLYSHSFALWAPIAKRENEHAGADRQGRAGRAARRRHSHYLAFLHANDCPVQEEDRLLGVRVAGGGEQNPDRFRAGGSRQISLQILPLCTTPFCPLTLP